MTALVDQPVIGIVAACSCGGMTIAEGHEDEAWALVAWWFTTPPHSGEEHLPVARWWVPERPVHVGGSR